MILYYNKKGIGDVLIAYIKEGGKQSFERKADVSRIYDPVSKDTLGFNFFKASRFIPVDQRNGLIAQDDTFLELLNSQITDAGFQDILPSGENPRIVTGFVEKMEKHPDSDHMHVCRVNVGSDTLQIVCGAPNIDQGQKVVVARVGALMPDGMIIRPSILRGIASDGMICSAKELALPGAPQKRGILVLNESTAVGRNFFSLLRTEQVQ